MVAINIPDGTLHILVEPVRFNIRHVSLQIVFSVILDKGGQWDSHRRIIFVRMRLIDLHTFFVVIVTAFIVYRDADIYQIISFGFFFIEIVD